MREIRLHEQRVTKSRTFSTLQKKRARNLNENFAWPGNDVKKPQKGGHQELAFLTISGTRKRRGRTLLAIHGYSSADQPHAAGNGGSIFCSQKSHLCSRVVEGTTRKHSSREHLNPRSTFDAAKKEQNRKREHEKGGTVGRGENR